MRDRLGRAVAALGALVALAALLVGVPVVLSAAAGWPLPTAVPSWESIRTAMTGASIPDDVIVKTIAVIGWLAWTQIVVSAVIEVSAWIRGRVAPSIPFAGPIQVVVRQLVLAVLIVGSSSRVTPVPVAARQPVAIAYEPLAVSEQVSPAVAEQGEPAPQSVDLRYTVVPRDSLWKLAELHLGDGLRWRELWELNRGVPQPDGRCLTDPDLIRPGWVLRFPQDAVGVAPVEAPATAEPPAQASPPPHADQPATPAPVATAPVTTAQQVPPTTATTSPAANGSARVDAAPGTKHDDGGIPVPVGIAGAGLLAAGLVTTLNRLRRAQVRRRMPGRAIATCPVTEDVERRLRSAADLDGASRLDIALAVLGAAARPHSGAAIEAVLAGGDIEVLFTEPVGGDPHLFTVDAGGRAWTLPAHVTEAQLVASAHGRVAPVPALVPLGRIDDRTLLIDLEAMPVTVVSGPEETVDSILWEAAASLTTSVWSDDVRVLILGHQVPGLERLDRAEVVDPDVALAAIEADLLATRAELAAHRTTTLLDARASDGSWTTTVVIAGLGAPTDVVQSLADLAADGAGLVVLTGVDVASAQRRVTVDGPTVMVSPPGVAAQRVEVSADEREQVGALIEVARCGSAEDAPPLLAPVPENEQAADGETPPTAGPPLLVRVLGRVEIDGAALDRRLAEELTVYLALHPEGADEQRLKSVLWPEGPPSPHAFNQAVSRTRTALGTAPDGMHYLPRLVAREQYRLSELVTTDLAILESALRTALTDENAATIDALADALRLVRGEPFEGVRAGYAWAHSEGFASRAEILAADAAHVVASWHIEPGEATAALWSIGQGLLAAPADEALYRDRMRAYALSGNVTGVESAMKELCRIADAQEPYDSLHPETVELYNTLTRRRVG
jgi:nucleoid-associated protein YgaU